MGPNHNKLLYLATDIYSRGRLASRKAGKFFECGLKFIDCANFA